MEVDDDLESVVLRPCHRVLQVWKLALNVRLPVGHIPGPIADLCPARKMVRCMCESVLTGSRT
jgi:hypothetical protein